MTRSDIIRLAEQAGWSGADARSVHVERFAKLVEEAKREACAKLCDGWTQADGDKCAAAIRAMGET